ncbi:putative gamma-glutamylcyclotransferase At3g02910 [Magnolia sinica]|uniref:putative gamma-glutamylcyclotransferase At3g02910 n=1 Tax=Magnolia sinica TaxID=86752 RepID=UPI00265B1F28|nr:putative gamma-glutamylcyclotransferase At3g02910 [Magnolia sinica]
MGAEEDRTLIFTYGTLKRGFSNHGLIQEAIRTGDAVFIGVYHTVDKYPLVCGPYNVPFLLNLPGSGDRIRGELYAVSAYGLARMDELEGISTGHYERLPIVVGAPEDEGRKQDTVRVEAYYAHRSYAEELWKRSGEKGICAYTENEARGYVRRKDRPQEITFLEQIRMFVASSPDITTPS